MLGYSGSCTMLLAEVDDAYQCHKMTKEWRNESLFQLEFEILLELNGATPLPFVCKPILATSDGHNPSRHPYMVPKPHMDVYSWTVNYRTSWSGAR
ncbi:hypothetical protein E2C01_084023 [Portunus trituberculatus]|uniref:Uncharacterized protein n=1 Tax=Portunus trituberculatus TaxID=210409 RepID=A0A5B7J3S1_PORTR|nr:hypothetical protein [Portunus trituberculatus]